MNIGQMSANDCAVWCLEHDGWVYECGVEGDPVWCHRDALKKWRPNMDQYPDGSQFSCPYPLTILGANRAIPVDWEVSKKDGIWKAKNTNRPSAAEVFVVSCPDDVTALYRLAVMCKIEDQPQHKRPSRATGESMSIPMTSWLRGEIHVCKYCGCSVVNRKCEGCGAADVVQINIDQPPKNLPTHTTGELIALGVMKGLCYLAAFCLGMAIWELVK